MICVHGNELSIIFLTVSKTCLNNRQDSNPVLPMTLAHFIKVLHDSVTQTWCIPEKN